MFFLIIKIQQYFPIAILFYLIACIRCSSVFSCFLVSTLLRKDKIINNNLIYTC